MFDYSELVTRGRVIDLYVLSRFCYRVGEPIIPDNDYQLVHDYLLSNGVALEYVNRSYDDDPIPYGLLQEFKLEHLIPSKSEYSEKYGKYIEDEKSLSVRAIESYRDFYQYCQATKGKDKVISPKINGVNIKSLFTKEEGEELCTLKIGKTRGRKGSDFDITRNLSRILKLKVNLPIDKLILFGESYVKRSSLGQLVSPNGTVVKVERSAAMSMLRTDYKDSDYSHLKYSVFRCEGLSESLYESLGILRECGIDVVKSVLVKSEDIPDDFDAFYVWAKDIMSDFYDYCVEEEIPTDGLVVDVDDLTFTGEVNGQYSDKNVALKFDYWSHKYYRGVVDKIEIMQRGYECSITAVMFPVITDDQCEAKRVTLHSPAIMIRESIKPGSAIYFKRDSDVINKLVHGEELEKLLRGD